MPQRQSTNLSVATSRRGVRLNVRLLALLIVGSMVLVTGALTAREIRRHSRSERALSSAREAQQRNDWVVAAKQLRQYLARHPDDQGVLQEYAEANLAIEPPAAEHLLRAIRGYRRLVELDPRQEAFYERIVDLARDLGDFSEVEKYSRKWLEVGGGMIAGRTLGEALFRQHRPEEARVQLETQLEKFPGDVAAAELLGELLVDLDQADVARRVLDQAVADNPESAAALVNRAFFRRVHQQDRWAQEDLRRAEQLFEAHPAVVLKLSDEWRQWGELNRARSILERLDPQLQVPGGHELDHKALRFVRFVLASRLLQALGDREACLQEADAALDGVATWQRSTYLPFAVELYVSAGELDQAERAIAEYQKLIVELPDADSRAANRLLLMRAAVALARTRIDEAIQLLEEVVAGDSHNLEARRALWQAYSSTEQHARKLAQLEAYVRLKPDDIEATLQLAQTYRGLDWAKAAQYAEQAEKATGDVAARLLRLEAQIALVSETGLQDKLATPVSELRDLRDLHPGLPDVCILQARIAVLQGRKQEAQDVLRAALEGPAADPVVAVTLAGMYVRDGQFENAQAVLEDAARRFDDSAVPRLALARMQVEAGHRAEAIEQLQFLRGRLPGDVRSRVRLLELVEIQNDPAQAQALVDEVQRIEGPYGLQWRLEQARCLMRSAEFAQHAKRAESLLSECIDRRPAWVAPRVDLGQLCERNGRLDRAEQLYQNVVRSQPGFVPALVPLLSLLVRQGRYHDAEVILQRLPADTTGLESFRIQVAWEIGDYDTAVEELRKRIAMDARDAESRVLLARLYYRHDQAALPQAMELLDQAAAIDPQGLTAVSARAWILRREGDLARADALIDEHVAARRDFDAFALRAAHLEQTGRFESAELDYRQLVSLAGQEARGCAQLGQFLESRGRKVEAMEVWRRGLQADPDDAVLQRRLSQALLASDDSALRAEGADLLERRLAANPNDAGDLYLKAAWLSRTGGAAERARSRQILEGICRNEPRHIAAWHLLGRQMWEGGQAREALERLVQARGANPASMDLILLQAQMESALGRDDVAERLVELILEREPDHGGAHELQVQIELRGLAASGAHEELLRRVAGLAGAPPQARLDLAHLLAATQDPRLLEQAETLVHEVLADHPKSPEAHVALGRIEYHRGDFEASQGSYRRALEANPGNIEALNDLAWLLATELDGSTEALGLINSALEQHPGEARLLHTRAVVFGRLGKHQAREADLQQCIELGRAEPAIQVAALLELARSEAQRGAWPDVRRRLERIHVVEEARAVLDDEQRAEVARLQAGLAAAPR